MSTEQAMDSMIPSEAEHATEQQVIEQQVIEPQTAEPQTFEQQVIEPTRTAHGDLRKIIIHNDEITPYDFVTGILGDLFMLSEELADHVALTAHTKGVAVVVVRPRAEAEKLVKVAHGRARMVSYPLTFSVEQE